MSTMVIINETEFPTAPAYYRMCTWEPVAGRGHLRLGRVIAEQNLTMEKVFDIILRSAPAQGGVIMLVTHAAPEAIILPLVKGHKRVALRDAMLLLSSGRSASSIYQQLDLSEKVVERLLKKMHAVHEKKLARVEVRGCRLGQDRSTMQAAKDFFGARCIGAPTEFNAYGNTNPDLHSAHYKFKRYDRQRGGNRYWMPGDHEVGMEFRRTGRTTFRMRNVRANTPTAWRRWAVSMFPIRFAMSVPVKAGVSVPMPWDMRSNNADPNPFDDVKLPRTPIHFQLTDKEELHLPLEAAYRANLEVIEGAPRPAVLGPIEI